MSGLLHLDAKRSHRIFGGMFGLEARVKRDSHPSPFCPDKDILFVNARSALSLLLDLVRPVQVWLPSYLCGAILEPLAKHQCATRFYGVNYDLKIASTEWMHEVAPRDLVLLISYFGFPCDATCATEAKKRGAWVLEDACQSLPTSGHNSSSDFVLFSPRKFVGVPDGGILRLNAKVESDVAKLSQPPLSWWLRSLTASFLRTRFDSIGGDREWFALFRDVESESPVGDYAMSELSSRILVECVDYEFVARKRVQNYEVLSRKLGEIALFPVLPSGVVPLGFPIRIKERDKVIQGLFRHEIFPAVHWPIEDIVPPDYQGSHRLASEIMTLPCDQRYDDAEMERIAMVVLSELRS